MFIGVPKEIKNQEYRVALTPEHVETLVNAGHCVAVGYGAGVGSGFSDQDYKDVGAYVVDNRSVWNHDIIVKVKEPLPEEYVYFRENQLIFSYLHLAANRPLVEELIKTKATGIAFETILDEDGRTPVLDPMSQIAGELSVHKAAQYLHVDESGKGILISDARVVILGCGTAGKAAAHVAAGMGACVTIIEVEGPRMIEAWKTVFDITKPRDASKPTHQAHVSTRENIHREVVSADVVIGCVHIPGAPATRLVTENMVKEMQAGSVLVDIAIDQGGCFATSWPTTHSEPTFVKHDVIHYCVANMPGIVPVTASGQIADHILPYLLKIIDDPLSVPSGVNVHAGKVVHLAVAKALDL